MTESGTGLIGESSGIFYERRRWSDFELSALSFGYGLSVTTLQLARMYSVIASGGIKRPLSIVRTGYDLEEERVVDQKHANALLAMMEKVVSHEGSGRKARVPGYRVAGKTGTSRKAVSGGYGEEYVNIFSGIAPASDPQLVVVVLINEPSGDLYYAGDTAAPVFSRIMSSSLQMLNVPPDDKALSSLASLEKRYD
jgi:cell division protein FtsI (penicillin-binding protein 3)